MNTTPRKSLPTLTSLKTFLVTVAVLVGFSVSSLLADPVYCWINSANSVPHSGVNLTTYTSGLSGTSTASGIDTEISPAKTGSGATFFGLTGIVSGTSPWVQVTPTVSVSGGTYVVYGTRGTDSSGNSPNSWGITYVNCTGSASTTTFFQTGGATLNGWKAITTITVTGGSTTPTVKFTFASGNASRSYVDAFKFDYFNNCATTAKVNVDDTVGPYTTATTSFTVNGITTASAVAVTLYKYSGGTSTLLQQNTYSAGSAPASVTFTGVSGLATGDRVFATQTIGAQEGCKFNESSGPGTVVPIGSGAPAKVRFALGLRNTGTTGPLGANGGGTGNIYLLGASGSSPATTVAQYSAPTGIPSKNIISAGVGWQTLTFINGTDPAHGFSDNSSVSSVPGTSSGGGLWAAIEGLYIVADNANDSGNYTIYIDNVKNGDSVLSDFESATLATSDVFNYPGFSGTTHPNLLGSGGTAGGTVNPNTGEVAASASIADVGTQYEKVNFQFNDLNTGNWLRLTTASAAAHLNPAVDMNKTISIRVLVLPAGVSQAALNLSQPANQTLCAGSALSMGITANVNYFGGSGSPTYQWKKNGTDINAGNANGLTGYNTATLQCASLTTANAGSYSCAVSVTISGGTQAGAYSSECNQATLTVNQPTASVNSPAICSGASATLTATTDASGPTYSWSPGGETSAAITVSPTATASYTVTVTDGTTTCQNTGTGTVTVNPVPSASANSATICAGGSATLTASTDIGTSYLWAPGGETSASITVSPTATATYTVTVTAGGCQNNGTGTVTVDPVPSASVNSPTICSGASATLTASTDIGTSYLWAPGGATSAAITVSPTATASYTVTVTAGGCQNNGIGTVTVNPLPTAGVNSATICAGGSATLTATTDASGPTYSWSPGGETTAAITVSPTATASYTVTVTDGTTTCQKSGSGTVTVNPLPTASVNSETICSGASATLTATTDASGPTYSWSPGGETTAAITVSPTATASYTVTVTDGTTTCQKSGSGTVTVNTCGGTPVTITSVVNNGDGSITINYSGGSGTSFTLMKSSDVTLTPLDSWTVVTDPANQPATPGSFTITPAGNEFYAIRSN